MINAVEVESILEQFATLNRMHFERQGVSVKGGHAARERIGLGVFTMDPDPAEKKHVESIFRVRDFSDVTLASEGETKNGAHKMVLISASRKKIQQKVEQII